MLQTDSLLSRLKALKERIDATEAHVTLDLDHRRNQIVSFNLVSSRAFFHTPLSQHDDLTPSKNSRRTTAYSATSQLP